MMTPDFELGDLIMHGDERGIICATHPLVMKSTNFHCYVPISLHPTILERGHDPTCNIPVAVLERIKEYLARRERVLLKQS